MTDILEVATNLLITAQDRKVHPTEWKAGPWAYRELFISADRNSAVFRRGGNMTLFGIPVRWTDKLPEREIALYAGDARV